jgi:hypothetical protein
MIIPRYWAEARLQHRERRRQVTLQRFGWSDVSVEDAQAHADRRVREALSRLLAGEMLPRQERRVAYNGAEGVPIREEVVERDADIVITRNGYGALCLNTPNVFFADIDFRPEPRGSGIVLAVLLLGVVVGIGSRFGLEQSVTRSFVFGFIAALLFGYLFAVMLRRTKVALSGGHENEARKRVVAFLAKHPHWRLRLYRTPAGLRLLAVHRVFEPREAEVTAAFEALGVDPTYARMCRNQNCFRARLTPKPWRIGMQRLRAPYAAAWRPEHAELPARREWIAEYDRASAGYAACRYLETLGAGTTDIGAEYVQQLHDLMCQAERDLPLA